jgi:protease-4
MVIEVVSMLEIRLMLHGRSLRGYHLFKWRGEMNLLIAKILMVVGAMTVIVLAVTAGVILYLRIRAKTVPTRTLLEADFEMDYVEHLPEDRLGRLLMGRTPHLLDAVAALARASEDKRVTMLVAKVGATRMKLAKIQEIRDAVIRFREKGKKAIAYAETFGESGPGNSAYYLATAFDRIYLQPSGNVGLTGLGIKTPFLRDLLKKAGVEPKLSHRKEYKSAAYLFTESKYNEPHREADQAVLESLLSQIVDGIARARALTANEVLSLVQRGPFSSEEAVREKLVDGLAYRDQVYEAAKKEAGENSRPMHLFEYLKRAGRPYAGKRKIALIYGVGPIVRGKSRWTPLGSHIMGSKTVAESFRQAVKDKTVKAIIFRINSPGGSYVASDVIWRETLRAKQEGKPVIVSMSEVAGSGGYFVAAAADKIIAHPGTITGSIGVVSGKMLTSEMWDKIGVHWGELSTHANAGLWSSTQDYSSEQWAKLQAWLDTIYQDFITKVAEGRRLDVGKVYEIAKGRIWSGKDARDIGLVDELGGFEEAVRAAKAAAGIGEEGKVGLRIFPEKRPLWKRLLSGKSERSETGPTVALDIFQDGVGRFIPGILDPIGVLQMRDLPVE